MTAPAPEELVTFVTTDIAAITRGRSIAARDLEAGLEKGVGWVPANLALTPFDEIASPNPFGSAGDLRLIPDPAAKVRVTAIPDMSPLHFYHSDITGLDGRPWEGCVRSMLKSAVADLQAETGLSVVSAFEQEFQILGADWPVAPSFSLSAQRRADPFAPLLVAALREAGADPETFLPEYGRDQFEMVCGPSAAVAAADRAVTIREITRELAAQFGWKASFAPKTDPAGVGNPEGDALVVVGGGLRRLQPELPDPGDQENLVVHRQAERDAEQQHRHVGHQGPGRCRPESAQVTVLEDPDDRPERGRQGQDIERQ